MGTEAKKSSAPQNVNYPVKMFGVYVKVKERVGTDGKKVFDWNVRSRGAELGNGFATSRKEAEDAAWKLLQKDVQSKVPASMERAKARNALLMMLKNRPHLMLGAAEVIFDRPDVRARLKKYVKSQELKWWKKDGPLKKPLPTHISSLQGDAAVDRIYELLQKAGMMDEDDYLIHRGAAFKKMLDNFFGPEVTAEVCGEELPEEEEGGEGDPELKVWEG